MLNLGCTYALFSIHKQAQNMCFLMPIWVKLDMFFGIYERDGKSRSQNVDTDDVFPNFPKFIKR